MPDVQFILDHIGKPDIKHGLLDPWRAEIKTLSEFPNVWCKISGLVTEADHKHWAREQLKPYIDHVIYCFGFDRDNVWRRLARGLPGDGIPALGGDTRLGRRRMFPG